MAVVWLLARFPNAACAQRIVHRPDWQLEAVLAANRSGLKGARQLHRAKARVAPGEAIGIPPIADRNQWRLFSVAGQKSDTLKVRERRGFSQDITAHKPTRSPAQIKYYRSTVGILEKIQCVSLPCGHSWRVRMRSNESALGSQASGAGYLTTCRALTLRCPCGTDSG